MVAGHLLVAGSGSFLVDVFLDSPEYFVDRLKQTTHGTDPTVPSCQCTSRCRGIRWRYGRAAWWNWKGKVAPLWERSEWKIQGKAQLRLPLRKKKWTLSDPMLNVLHLS